MRQSLAFFVVTTILAFGLLAGCEKKNKEEQWKPIVDSLPWMIDVLEWCETYRTTQSVADQQDISNRVRSVLTTAEVKSVKGTVEKLMASGPDQFALQVMVGEEVRFASQSKDRPIERGSKVFEQVAKLEQGQCVIFTAKELMPIATFQRGVVCDPRYYVRFLDVQPCP